MNITVAKNGNFLGHANSQNRAMIAMIAIITKVAKIAKGAQIAIMKQ